MKFITIIPFYFWIYLFVVLFLFAVMPTGGFILSVVFLMFLAASFH